MLVPDALQIERLRARPRARDHQIAPELEKQSRQRGIVPARETGDALVGGQRALGHRFTEMQRDALEKSPVVLLVRLLDLPIALAPQIQQRVAGLHHGINAPPTGGTIKSAIARGRRQVQSGLGGARDVERIVLASDLPVRRCRSQTCLKVGSTPSYIVAVEELCSLGSALALLIPDLGVFPLLAAQLDLLQGASQCQAGHLARRDKQPVVPGQRMGRGMRRGEPDAQRQGLTRVGAQVDSQHLVGLADEHLATVQHTALSIADAMQGTGQIQLASIARDVALTLEIQPQVAQRLVAGLRSPDPMPLDKLCGPAVVALPQPGFHLRQIGGDVERQVALPRLARIERVLVQLQALRGHPAEHHRAQPPVPQRERRVPRRSWLVVP